MGDKGPRAALGRLREPAKVLNVILREDTGGTEVVIHFPAPVPVPDVVEVVPSNYCDDCQDIHAIHFVPHGFCNDQCCLFYRRSDSPESN